MPEPSAATPETAVPARFTARLRFARVSPRKMRYVVDLVRGKDYNSALGILRVCSKRGAPFCKKLLESAYENAMDIARNRNADIDGNRLHVVEARVDGGPIIKRWRPSSVRRPQQIKKRTCHIVFVLEERDLKESRRDRSKRQRKDRQDLQKRTTPAAKPVAGPGAPAADAPKGPETGKARAPETSKPKPPESPKA